MSKRVVLVGDVFGRWTLLEYIGVTKSEHRWRCLCVCGKEKSVQIRDIISGRSNSCGCLRVEKLVKMLTTHGHGGKKRSSEYNSWKQMRVRCSNPNDEFWMDYGGRGIKICDRWMESFSNFLEDMGEKPSKIHSLDRIDVNGNYEKSNCKWSTPVEQANNKRKTIKIEHNGVTLGSAQWAKANGISKQAVRDRVNSGWSHEEAITIKSKHTETFLAKYCKDNGTTIGNLAEKHGINKAALIQRVKKGWSMEKALNTPVRKKKKNKFSIP